MRDKIFSQLVTKYPGVKKKFLGLWADKLAPKVTEESQIEGVINELDNLPIPITELAIEFQKEGDIRVTEAEKEWKKKNPPTQPPKTDPPANSETTTDPPADDKNQNGQQMPEWFKPFAEKLEANEKKEKATSIAQKLKDNPKLKDLPETFWNKRKLPEKEEEIEAFADEAAADWEVIAPVEKGTGKVVTNTNKTGGNNKQAPKEEIDKILDNIKI